MIGKGYISGDIDGAKRCSYGCESVSGKMDIPQQCNSGVG